MSTDKKYLIELSQDQLDLVLGGIECAINEGYSEDDNILLLRYLKNKYHINTIYDDTKLSSEIYQEEKEKEIWVEIRDSKGNITAYRKLE